MVPFKNSFCGNEKGNGVCKTFKTSVSDNGLLNVSRWSYIDSMDIDTLRTETKESKVNISSLLVEAGISESEHHDGNRWSDARAV